MLEKQPVDINNNRGDQKHNTPKLRRAIITLAFLSICLGVGIYLLWRPDTIRIFSWLELLGLGAPIAFVRESCEPLYHFIPGWVIFSLPNGLWSFSYTLIITHLWLGRNSILKYFWLASIPIVGLGYETLQYAHVIPGTFCTKDLLLCAIGILLGTLVVYLSERM
ncbi:MAG: hypothetical protein ACOX30_01480 [Dethiobacteria bacterium]